MNMLRNEYFKIHSEKLNTRDKTDVRDLIILILLGIFIWTAINSQKKDNIDVDWYPNSVRVK